MPGEEKGGVAFGGCLGKSGFGWDGLFFFFFLVFLLFNLFSNF